MFLIEAFLYLLIVNCWFKASAYNAMTYIPNQIKKGYELGKSNFIKGTTSYVVAFIREKEMQTVLDIATTTYICIGFILLIAMFGFLIVFVRSKFLEKIKIIHYNQDAIRLVIVLFILKNLVAVGFSIGMLTIFQESFFSRLLFRSLKHGWILILLIETSSFSLLFHVLKKLKDRNEIKPKKKIYFPGISVIVLCILQLLSIVYPNNIPMFRFIILGFMTCDAIACWLTLINIDRTLIEKYFNYKMLDQIETY